MHFVIRYMTKFLRAQAAPQAEGLLTGEETEMRKLQNIMAHACVVLSVSLMTL